MNSLSSWIASNKLLAGIMVSFLFTVIWSVASWTQISSCYYCDGTAIGMWLSIAILGSLAFFSTFGYYIRNRIKNKQETQALEFDASAVELATVSSVIPNAIDPTQNKLTEEDLDKEIALFEKRKKLAQLKNEVINLETVGIRTSTSENLGQVITVNRGY